MAVPQRTSGLDKGPRSTLGTLSPSTLTPNPTQSPVSDRLVHALLTSEVDYKLTQLLRRNNPASTMISDFQPLEPRGNKSLLFKLPSLWYLLQWPELRHLLPPF